MAKLLFLWVNNAAGAADILLPNPYLGPPRAFKDKGQWEHLQTIAQAYFLLLVGYTIFVWVLSVFEINIVGLQQGEDAFLLCFATLACYMIVLHSLYYQEEEFLLVDNNGVERSCKSQFLQFNPLDHLCHNLVATRASYTSNKFTFGEEQCS